MSADSGLDDAIPDDGRSFRSTSGMIAVVVFGLLAVFLLGEAAVRSGIVEMLLLAPWVLLGVWTIYTISAASMLRVDRRGASMQNFLRRTSFGWQQVRDVDMRWQLEFRLIGRERALTCWGGPAQARSRRGSDRSTPSGYRALSGILRLREEAGHDADDPIRRSWDVPALIALGVLAVWAVVAVVAAHV